jgi:hypothetical protein
VLLEILIGWLVGVPALVLAAAALRARNRERWIEQIAEPVQPQPERRREAA